jgi:hypothetical protein
MILWKEGEYVLRDVMFHQDNAHQLETAAFPWLLSVIQVSEY